MKKLTYKTEIQASPEHVHATMLGLNDKKTYQQWTAPFSPTPDSQSTWEGSWDKGSKIQFVALNDSGKKEGMVSRIAENTPGKYVSIQHLGLFENGVEITEGPKVEGWANAMENYTFEPKNGGTLVTAEIDVADEYAEYFDNAWPKALEKLKAICEVSKQTG
jgi:hypothetical protein